MKQIIPVMVLLLMSCLMAGCYHPHAPRAALPSAPVSTPAPVSWRAFLAARPTHPGGPGWWTRADLDDLEVRSTRTSVRVRGRGAQITMPWDDDPSPLPAHFHFRQYGDNRPVPLKGGTLHLPTPQSTQVWAGDEALTLTQGGNVTARLTMAQVLDHWLDEPLVNRDSINLLSYERPRKNLTGWVLDPQPVAGEAFAVMEWYLAFASIGNVDRDRGYYLVWLQSRPQLAVLPLRYIGDDGGDVQTRNVPMLRSLNGHLLMRFRGRLEAVQPDGETARLLARTHWPPLQAR